MKSSMSARCPDNRLRLLEYKSPTELNSRSLRTDVEDDERYRLATSVKIGLGLHWASQGVIYKELVGIDGKKRNRLIYHVVESLEVRFSPLLCLTMCCCGYLRVLRRTLIACQTAGKRGERRNLGRLAGLGSS